MEEELTGPWSWLRASINHTDWRVTFPGGSWIQWVTGDNLVAARGLRADAASVDEADDIPIQLYDALVKAWFSEHHSLRQTIISGTPRRGRHGLLYRSHARGIGKLRNPRGERFQNHRSFHATCYDFPEFISAQAIREASDELPPEVFAREWMCDFDAAEGLVYAVFSDAFHVREPDYDAEWREFIVGLDWGYEDPTAIVILGVCGHGRDVTIHQLDEVYERHLTTTDIIDIAKRIEAIYPGARWYADPSRPSDIMSLRREAKVRIQGADNSIADGVSTVQNALHRRKRLDGSETATLYIAPNCAYTRLEFEQYRRKRDARDKETILEDIEDKNNHAMDALRYALHTHFGGPDRRLKTEQV
jgi:hypothetical protein